MVAFLLDPDDEIDLAVSESGRHAQVRAESAILDGKRVLHTVPDAGDVLVTWRGEHLIQWWRNA